MKTKNDIDIEVALDMGMSRREAARVTTSFLNRLKNAIVEEEVVRLAGFGRFSVSVMEGLREVVDLTHYQAKEPKTFIIEKKIRVHFRKARPFALQLKEYLSEEDNMEKFGVDEQSNQEDLEKKAAKGCPECGKELEKHGSVVMCPVHGTEPFEAKDGQSS